MSRKKILIVGGSVTVVSGLLACCLAYFVNSVQQGVYSSGGSLTGSGTVAVLLSVLGASGLSLTSIAGFILTPILAYFGVSSDTSKRLVVSVDDAAKIASYMRLYSQSIDADARAKIREAAKSETDSLFDTWFPLDAPTP